MCLGMFQVEAAFNHALELSNAESYGETHRNIHTHLGSLLGLTANYCLPAQLSFCVAMI